MAQNRIRWFRKRSGRTYYFGPQPSVGAPGTIEDNPIDLCDEGDD